MAKKKPDYDMESPLTISTIGNGMAPELFDREMQNVIANIIDEHTPIKKVRKITLEFDIIPGNDRTIGTVSIAAKSKLPVISAPISAAIFRKDETTGELRAYAPPIQPGLFEGNE